MKKLSESFIDDVIRRSRNGEDRMEDDIELLDRDAFCEYLKGLYSVTEQNMSIENVTGSIQVPITRIISVDILYNNPDKVKAIFITFGRMTLPEELINILQTKYKADNPLSKAITISWDGKPIPNGICIEIIDLLLQYVPRTVLKKNIHESFIDDVIRRSRTGEEREEDNINFLSGEEFYKYLLDRYNKIDDSINITGKRIADQNWEILISVPITLDSKKSPKYLFIKFNESGSEMFSIGLNKFILKNKEILKDYDISYSEKSDTINITQDGKVSNKICIDVIDVLLDNAENPLLVKKEKLSESFIDDVIRRSRTGEERKEDNIDNLGMQEMYDYIIKHYEFIDHLNAWPMTSYGDSGEEFMIPLFFNDKTRNIPFHLVGTYHGGIIVKLVLQADSSDCADIMGVLNKQFYLTSLGYMGMKIRDKQGKVSNQLCIDFINTVIENVENPLMKKLDSVKESFIDDVIRRSRNGEDRQEDNIDNLDRDGFYDWFLANYECNEDIALAEKHINNGDVMTLISLEYKNHYYRMYLQFDDKGIERICQGIPIGLTNQLNKLFGDKFDLFWTNSIYQIIYKDGTISNKTIVDAIDRLIEVADSGKIEGLQPLLKKRTK